MVTVEGNPRTRGMLMGLFVGGTIPPEQADGIVKRMNGARRFNIAMREPGWLDADPPTWEWR